MPSLGTFDLVFLLLLIVVYISFSLGYRRGLLQGNLEGRIDKVLDLKEKAYYWDNVPYVGICRIRAKPRRKMVQ